MVAQHTACQYGQHEVDAAIAWEREQTQLLTDRHNSRTLLRPGTAIFQPNINRMDQGVPEGLRAEPPEDPDPLGWNSYFEEREAEGPGIVSVGNEEGQVRQAWSSTRQRPMPQCVSGDFEDSDFEEEWTGMINTDESPRILDDPEELPTERLAMTVEQATEWQASRCPCPPWQPHHPDCPYGIDTTASSSSPSSIRSIDETPVPDTSQHLRAEIEQVPQNQQANLYSDRLLNPNLQRSFSDRLLRRKGKGKGKGKSRSPVATTRRDGTDTICSICQYAFYTGERVYRTVCDHLFHETCWDGFSLNREVDCECPNCRGQPTARSWFTPLGNDARRSAQEAAQMRSNRALRTEGYQDAQPEESTPQVSAPAPPQTAPGNNSGHLPPEPRGPTPSTNPLSQIVPPSLQGTDTITTSFVTATQLAEWSKSWSPLSPDEYFAQQEARPELINDDDATGELPDLEAGEAPEAADEDVHIKTVSRTKLPDGKNSLLVDLGSRVNVIGKDTEKEFAAAAAANGHYSTYIPRARRLHVNGVGSDAAICDFEVVSPIAVKFEEHAATKESYRANLAEGCGSKLPAILGSDSMQEKDSVIILRKGKEILAFPGPGGYKIQWSPGTKLLPMKPAPSGHLVVPCDRFEELTRNSGTTETIAFWTDHTNEETPSPEMPSPDDKMPELTTE